MQLTVLKEEVKYPVLGDFGKGVKNSHTLNFSRSGAEGYCDKSCTYHPDNNDSNRPNKNRCYAARAEVRPDRVELANKLLRHEDLGPETLCRRALAELKKTYSRGKKVPWLRISAFGSVPLPENATTEFLNALRELLDYCDMQNIPVHFPVESQAKRDFYQCEVGTRATVRLSAQSDTIWLTDSQPASFVAGTTDMSRLERLDEAKRVAVLRREATGRKTIVCPAVASRYLEFKRRKLAGDPNARNATGSPRAKCGACIACSQAGTDVIYPAH